jgi:hypothetical protein
VPREGLSRAEPQRGSDVKVIELAPHQSWASPPLQLGGLRPDWSGLAGAAWTRVSRRSDASAFLGAVLKFLGSLCAGCRLRSSSHRWLLYTIRSIISPRAFSERRLRPFHQYSGGLAAPRGDEERAQLICRDLVKAHDRSGKAAIVIFHEEFFWVGGEDSFP